MADLVARVLRALMGWLAAFAGLVALMLLALYVFQAKLLYPAPAVGRPAPLPDGVELVELESGYALVLAAVAEGPGPLPAVVFAHGNGESAGMWMDTFAPLRDAGFIVALVEYPGYGGAPGSPGMGSIGAAMLAAFDWLVEHGQADPERVFAYGRSIGGGAATLLARDRPVAGLILESPFSTLAKLVREKGYPSWLLKDRYDNVAVVGELEAPVLVIHGRSDTLIPDSHADALMAANPRAERIGLDCGHNDCPRVWPDIIRFLGKR